MATPAIAGAGALVRQYFVEGFYPTGSANPSDGFTPSGALVKASLINSSVDMTGVAGYPSNREGWGRVLINNALHFDGDARKLIVDDIRNANGLSTNDEIEIPIEVYSGGQQLRATLVWVDPAASAGASFAAINDLDLEVVSPGGALYRGNVFSGGASTTGGTKDDRNNVEQVHVNNPASGEWIVRIKAAAVNVGTQGYALVVTGDVGFPSAPPVMCDGDADGNDVVDLDDITYIVLRLGTVAPNDDGADVDGSGVVDLDDLTYTLLRFGPCP